MTGHSDMNIFLADNNQPTYSTYSGQGPTDNIVSDEDWCEERQIDNGRSELNSTRIHDKVVR